MLAINCVCDKIKIKRIKKRKKKYSHLSKSFPFVTKENVSEKFNKIGKN